VSLRDQLQAIYDERQRLTPEVVVDAARDEASPLHDRFEWDDQIAGEKYRLDQARRLIRSVRVVYREADEKESARTIRAFHAIRDEQGTSYRPVEEVTESPLLTKLLLQSMELEWKQLMRRYGHFEEFLKLVRADVEDKAA
jgi:hypothetical protein